MKIYDEITKEEIDLPDLSAGYVYNGVTVTGRMEGRIEVLDGTVTEERPDGLRRLIPAQDITEPCQWYHTYTGEELAAQQEQPTDLDSRITALESGQADLQEALELLLSGATE